MNVSNIGKNIKKRRLELELTQAQLAERADVSNVHISHLENGTTTMSLDSLVSICKALDTTPDYILLGEYVLTDDRFLSIIQSMKLSQDELRFLIDTAKLLEDSRLNR